MIKLLVAAEIAEVLRSVVVAGVIATRDEGTDVPFVQYRRGVMETTEFGKSKE